MRLFTINRRKWHRGSQPGSRLLSPITKKLCCMGQIALQIGCAKKRIEDAAIPVSDQSTPGLAEVFHKALPTLVYYDRDAFVLTPLCRTMIATNDNPDITDSIREQRLQAQAKEAGFELEFIN